MKHLFGLTAALLIAGTSVHAQEAVQELSKKARKGYMQEAVAADGGYTITYKMAGDKNKDEVSYESYRFDNGMKFLKSEDASAPKQTKDDKPDKTVTGLYASVGGCSSFDILSMKLKFSKTTQLKTWDYKKQRYVTKKTISSETFKPKSENGKYIGFAAYNNNEDESLFVLAGADSKVNKRGTDFFVLTVNTELDIVEKPVDITGSQSLVFTAQLDNGDVALVFAPKKGSPDISMYTYLRYTTKGEVKNKVVFKSPSNNLLIVDASEKDGAVFFCATSTKSDDAFDEVFEDYAASISNPCFTEGENKQDMKWTKKADERMEHFHLLKFTNDKFDFATTAAISEFKERFKTSPDDKHADPYKGKKFTVQQFEVTSDGEYLIAGQLNGRQKMGSSTTVKTYEDIVCLHFNKAGQLKAQYGVEKMNTDKKSEIFPVVQSFVPAKDGKSMYWMIMEVKGFKGYADFVDAYNGNATYYPRFFPRIAKLDVQSSTVNKFAVLGDENYYVSKSFLPIVNKDENSIVFVGSDEDSKKLWLSKYTFQ